MKSMICVQGDLITTISQRFCQPIDFYTSKVNLQKFMRWLTKKGLFQNYMYIKSIPIFYSISYINGSL